MSEIKEEMQSKEENEPIPQEADEEEKKIYKEIYQDSYFFEELSSCDPVDWINIPKPLKSAILAIKKCLVSNNKTLISVTEKTHLLSTQAKGKFKKIDSDSILIHKNINENQEIVMRTLQEFQAKMESELVDFKAKLTKDLDFKQKSLDGKIAYLDEQVFSSKTIVNGLPKSDEIDKRIKVAAEAMRERVKTEINDHFIRPELITITDTFNALNESTAKFQSEYAEYQQSNLEKFHNFQSEITELMATTSAAISASQDIIFGEIKTTEKTLNPRIEKNSKGVDALNVSFHEINHKYFAEFRNFTKEIEEQKAKYKAFVEEIAGVKKEIKEINDLINPPDEGIEESSEEKTPIVEVKPEISEKVEIGERSVKAEKPVKKPQQTKKVPIEKLKRTSILSLKPAVPDYSEKFLKLEQYVDSHIQLFEDKLNHEINHFIRPLEKKLKESLISTDTDLNEIKQKLSWLPINLSQIQGKSPTEARIYTLEARLRTEENSRMESINKLMRVINSLQYSSPSETDIYLPPIRALSVTHEGHFSQETINERFRKADSQLQKKKTFLNSSLDFSGKHLDYKTRSPPLINLKAKQASFVHANQ